MIEITDEMIKVATLAYLDEPRSLKRAIAAVLPMIRTAVLDEAQRAIEAKGMKLTHPMPNRDMQFANYKAWPYGQSEKVSKTCDDPCALWNAMWTAAPVITLKDIVP